MKIVPVTSSPMVGVSVGDTVIVTSSRDTSSIGRLIGKVTSSTTVGLIEFYADWEMGVYGEYTSDDYSVSWLLSQGYKLLVFQ